MVVPYSFRLREDCPLINEMKMMSVRNQNNPEGRKQRFDCGVDDVLRNIKEKLTSRDPEQQKIAVNWLIRELTPESCMAQSIVCEKLLGSQVVASLCETLMSLDESLVRLTLNCLSSFAANEQFYKTNHVFYVSEAILRAGHFLAMGKDLSHARCETIEMILVTLKGIFDRTDDMNVSVASICDGKQVLEFLEKILSLNPRSYQNIFLTASILSIVLKPDGKSTNVCEKREKNELLVVSVVEKSLNSMRRIVDGKSQSERKFAFRAIAMISAVCASVVSLISTSHVDDDNASKSFAIKYRTAFENCIYSAMTQSVIPHINKIQIDVRYREFYSWFVACLNGFYDTKCSKMQDLSNLVASQGLLKTYLPHLTTLPIQDLRSNTFLLISRILTQLAATSLAVETWLGGSYQFEKFLFNAFKTLPNDSKCWASLLREADARADALLILFYYNFLTDLSNSASYLRFLVAYVLSMSGRENEQKPISILKALWFTFCVAADSHEKPSRVESYESAVTTLYEEMETAGIEQCYTHHPAIVLHCLRTTSLSDSMRGRIVCLWLSSGGDVQSLLNGNVELMSHCFLDVIQTGSPEMVEVVMQAVRNLTEDHDDAFFGTIGTVVWELLPRMLAARDKLNDANLEGILRIAGRGRADEVSDATIVRSLYLLVDFIVEKENDLPLLRPALRQAYILLVISNRRNDKRGLDIFVKEPRLFNILMSHSFSNNEPITSHVCFHCLSLLLHMQAKYSVQCETGLEIGMEDLLNHLSRRLNEGILNLTMIMLNFEIEKPVLRIRDFWTHESSKNLVRPIKALYMQFHIIHAQKSGDERLLSYQCLGALLRRCSLMGNKNLFKNLCEQPWTYLLIRITINEGDVTEDFFEFVSLWLRFRSQIVDKSQKYSPDSFGRDRFGDTLDLLVKLGSRMRAKQTKDVAYVKFLSSMMLFVKFLPEEIANELKDIYNQVNKNSTKIG